MSNDLPKCLGEGLLRSHLVECGYCKILESLIGVPSITYFLQEKCFLAIAAKKMRIITMIKLIKSFRV